MDDNLIKKIPPHNSDAEKSVLGAILIDPETVLTVSPILRGEDFYQPSYGILYDAMVELYTNGSPVDQVTLAEKLREKNAPSEISDPDFLVSLVTTVPTSANALVYAQIVAEKATLRRLIKMTDDISSSCYLDRDPLEAILDQAERGVFDLIKKEGREDFRSIDKIVIDVLGKIEAASKNHGVVTGLASGFADLDRMTTGFQPSDMILIAARPSMGKTAFALNIGQYATMKLKKKVAIFSLEMSREQLVNRLLASASRVDAQVLRNGSLREDDWERLVEGAGDVGESGLIIDDTPGITVSEMRTKCRQFQLEYGLDLVIVDYLQLMSASARARSESNRQQEISEISRALKTLARELEIPVIALSQLSRAVEKRDSKRPMLSDLRESGAIEQDADVVMFLYRDDYYNKDSEEQNVAEVILAKQRNGPVGTIKLTWIPKHTMFANRERDPQAGQPG